MKKRILFGCLLLVFVAGFVALRFVDPVFFDLFVFLITCLAVYELQKAARAKSLPFHDFLVMLFPAIVWACYFFSSTPQQALVFQVLALLVFFLVCMAMEIIFQRTAKTENSNQTPLLDGTFRTLSFLVYPTMLIGTLYGINQLGVSTGFVGLLLVFLVAACTDTFAFAFGIAIKGKKLCPKISPNKVVSGLVAGIVGGLVASLSMMWIFRFSNVFHSSVSDLSSASAVVLFLLAGAFGSIATQFGDLLESALKRRYQIKDFSNIIPGHGGVLDRMDGQMFCSTLVFVLFLIFL